MKNRKTKPENPGLEGHLNRISGLKKVRVRSNRVANPSREALFVCCLTAHQAHLGH